jgi:cytochrome P450
MFPHRVKHPPPYRFPAGLSGNLLWYAFRKFRPADPIALFTHLAEEFGPIAHYKLGPEHILFVNAPEYIHEILVAQNSNFVKERTVQRTRMLLGEGMITAEGARHREQRQAAQPAFHRQRIGSYADTMVSCAASLAATWKAGVVLDVSQEMMRLTLDIVARTLFSAELRGDVQEVVNAINHIMRLYNYLVMLPGVEVLVNLRIPGLARFDRDRRKLDEVVYRMIRSHTEHGEGHGDLLDMMLGSLREQGRALDEGTLQYLRDQVLTIFLAGYETTANALTWTWYLLSQNPEAERKFQHEVDTVLRGRLPDVEDVPRLRYTEMVLAESMRLYPPAWAQGRRALQDFQLGPYFLPAKTTVLMSQFVTHRDAKYFPEPLQFRPERFDREHGSKRPRFAYFPFGAGSRQCIGESFAWMEGVLILATIARRWKLALVPGHRVEPQPLITLRPKYGMRMKIEKRTGPEEMAVPLPQQQMRQGELRL